MPYILVEEVPEGMEAVDVVPRADYDTAVSERDQYAQQRDDALGQIAQAQQEVRDAKARYADYILGGNKTNTDPKPETPKHGPLSARELFSSQK
jgi:hypothetical protein